LKLWDKFVFIHEKEGSAQRLARARFPKRWPVLQQAQQVLRGPWLLPFPAA
jgi:hypothetical protein